MPGPQGQSPTPGTTKERLAAAAFALFDERGYDSTTVDDIAERAGVGRTTFFRTFRTKDDVIFPDHEAVLAGIELRLATSTPATAVVAVTEAARSVLDHYLAEGDLARSRYRLTRTVPALRAREIAGIQQYQHLFRRYLHGWLDDRPEHALRAELLAAAVVTAHNHVLRRWLREETTDPHGEFDDAMRTVFELFDGEAGPQEADGAIVVFRTTRSLESVLPGLRAVLGEASTAD